MKHKRSGLKTDARISCNCAQALDYLVQDKVWERSVSAAAVDFGQCAPLSVVRSLTSLPCCGCQVLFMNILKLDHHAKPIAECIQSACTTTQHESKALASIIVQHLLAADRNAVQLLQFGTSCP